MIGGVCMFKHMSSYIFFAFALTIIYQPLFAQKILKVQGNKLVISTKKLSVEEGDVLTITSDGFEAGKVKILSVGSKTAIGKIVEGSALVGDSVKSGGSVKSNSSSDDSDDSYSTSSKKSKKGKSGKGGFAAHLGFTYAMLSNITSQQGDYALDGQTGLFLMGEYRVGKSIYQFGLRRSSGDATFTSKDAALSITGAEMTATNLFARIANPYTKNFYFTYGGQVSLVSVEDTMTWTSTGKHTLDLKGLGALGGAGYDFYIGSLILKAESLFEINYYFLNSSTVPGASSSFDSGAFMIYGLHFNFSVGYKF